MLSNTWPLWQREPRSPCSWARILALDDVVYPSASPGSAIRQKASCAPEIGSSMLQLPIVATSLGLSTGSADGRPVLTALPGKGHWLIFAEADLSQAAGRDTLRLKLSFPCGSDALSMVRCTPPVAKVKGSAAPSHSSSTMAHPRCLELVLFGAQYDRGWNRAD